MLFMDSWLLYCAARGEKLNISSQEFFEKLAAKLIDADATTEATMTGSTMVARANAVASSTKEF